jgi:hypothetical protein
MIRHQMPQDGLETAIFRIHEWRGQAPRTRAELRQDDKAAGGVELHSPQNALLP